MRSKSKLLARVRFKLWVIGCDIRDYIDWLIKKCTFVVQKQIFLAVILITAAVVFRHYAVNLEDKMEINTVLTGSVNSINSLMVRSRDHSRARFSKNSSELRSNKRFVNYNTSQQRSDSGLKYSVKTSAH